MLGNNEKNNIVEYVEKYVIDKKNNFEITDLIKQREYLEFGTVTYTEKTRAVIKVQDGCDRFCTYCIIPYARGRVRSRKIENVIEEIKRIVAEGIKEVVITGIHIVSYGKDFNEDIGFIDLLEEINKIEGLKRIRLGSIEPTIITEKFVERLKKLDKICDHFHLSLQSGSDSTLKRMNRRYTVDEFKKGVALLKQAYPNVSLTTDIIAGFPGETEQEFEETCKLVEEVKFYKVHVFKYSKREGTKAAEMKNQINGEIKNERSNRLIRISNKIQQEILNKYIGKNVEVLLEDREKDYIQGHTSNYILVKTKSEKYKENTIVNLKITKVGEMELIGE